MNSRRLEDLVKEFKGENHDDPVVNYCLCWKIHSYLPPSVHFKVIP